MTNREKYISSFSGVEPSDKIKERILNMTTTRKRISLKTLAVVLAAVMLIAAAMITANAATDGELVKNFIVLLNGEEIDSGDYVLKEELVTDENGDTQNRLSFSYNGECGENDLFIISGETESDVDDVEINIGDESIPDESVHYEIIE